MIYLPFIFRLFWGIAALCASLLRPEWPVAWFMLDKNNPVTALLFDLTGAMILLGVLSAFVRGFMFRASRLQGLPKQDRLALGLITGIIVIGFTLEGARIAMTGRPPGAEYAFLGYLISQLFSNLPGLTDIYGYIWYSHAILTGAFIAYLPFSRMIHTIMAPVALVMNAIGED
jgi:nitrate reductase gamma subunit